VAHLAANRPPESTVLRALVEAHAGIEPIEIYEILKVLRNTGQNPSPSLASVNQGLEDLLDRHAQTAMAGFKRSEDSAEPMLACTQQILALGNRHQIDTLSNLLAAYHQSTSQQQTIRVQEIKSACEALRTQPIENSALEMLTQALAGWALLCRPLILFDIHRDVQEPDFETPTDLVRELITSLTTQQRYDVAKEVTSLSRNLLSSMPTAVERLDEDELRIERVLLDAKMKPLEDFIDGFKSDFGLLSQALKKKGFGQNSAKPASSLWDVFVKVAEATNPAKSAEPWMLIRDLAIHLNHNVRDPEAASALVRGLIQYGDKVSTMPALLGTLREDLRLINADHHADASRPTKAGGKRKIWPAAVALTAFCAITLYLGFDGRHWQWLKTFAKTSISSPATDIEIEPPVGTGQHFSLGNVRYCHFQQERLRAMKENVQGAEDTRAFNLLVVDYNARCSDFFYQDRDVETVTAEIAANRQRLVDEAGRIMSTWPGHATAPVFAPPK
jgi:hypothetical protein